METAVNMKKRKYGVGPLHVTGLAVVIMIFILVNTVSAMEIPTGNSDFSLRWDNTFKYNYGARLKSPDKMYLLNPNMDDGERNFNKGTVSNRLDILSELDLSYKHSHGFRFSGAFWYDQRYHDSLGNDSVSTSNRVENSQPALGLSGKTKRQDGGPYGEFLDAFAFSHINLGSVPVNLKIGRHTIYWGESLFSYSNGICYSQFPVDMAKGVAVPGTEAKELFRPLFNVSGQAQLTESISLAAQYFLEWQPNKIPESGSYWSAADYLLKGADSLILVPGYSLSHGSDVEPDGRHDWGVALKLSPQFLGGSLGLYYRRTTDKLPQLNVDLASGKYFLAYGDGIDILGLSLTKVLFGTSIGFEYSYRRNMPLRTGAVILAAGHQIEEGDLAGARGNTHHALINTLGMIGKTPLFDTASYMAELTFNRLDKITQGEQCFMGGDVYTSADRSDREAWAVQALFTPTWLNVFSGMDLSMPIGYGIGISGVSPVTSDAKGSTNASIGLSLNIDQKYTVKLSYVTYHGRTWTNPTTGALTTFTGNGSYNDRDTISLTFKFAF